ncbi:MAG: hypothetical protein JSV50_04935 [Desulfobacteraceae bacterium]|nr:MAG: hypothetical protein JSV50_04935 [Desulfobacteraceae bacterium]
MEKRSMIIPATKGRASMSRLWLRVRRPITDPIALALRPSITPRAMIAGSDMPKSLFACLCGDTHRQAQFSMRQTVTLFLKAYIT